MIIEIGNCTDEKNKLRKTFNSRLELTGHIKDASSIIDPIILIEANLSTIAGCNYLYIPKFKRYYYIKNMSTNTNTTCTIEAHVDVLKSFENQILDCSGYVDRQEDIVSVMIQDPQRPKQANPAISTVPFDKPSEANGFTYCLITTKSV